MTGIDDPMIDRLVRWGESELLVRAMILTSSRAVPGAPIDELSDYDVILILDDSRDDMQTFYEDAGWMATFGRVLANYQDPVIEDAGRPISAYVTQFEDGLKIDFTLWPAGLLQDFTAADYLPPELDAGYRILLDKDGLAAGLRPPSYRGYLPAPPSEVEFRAELESFFLDALYVAKCLRREEPFAARHVQENHLKQEHLFKALEWLGQIDHGWKLRTGPHGRRMGAWLRPDLRERLEATYTSLDPEESRTALLGTFDLYCSVMSEAAGRFRFEYPLDLERRIYSMITSTITR